MGQGNDVATARASTHFPFRCRICRLGQFPFADVPQHVHILSSTCTRIYIQTQSSPTVNVSFSPRFFVARALRSVTRVRFRRENAKIFLTYSKLSFQATRRTRTSIFWITSGSRPTAEAEEEIRPLPTICRPGNSCRSLCRTGSIMPVSSRTAEQNETRRYRNNIVVRIEEFDRGQNSRSRPNPSSTWVCYACEKMQKKKKNGEKKHFLRLSGSPPTRLDTANKNVSRVTS